MMRTSIDDRELIELCGAYLERVRSRNELARQLEHVSPGRIDVEDRLDADMYGAELVRLEIARMPAHTAAGRRAKDIAYAASVEGADLPGGSELIESLLSELRDQPAPAITDRPAIGSSRRTRQPTRIVGRVALSIVCLAAFGAAVLQWLGPPTDHISRDQPRSTAQQSARPPEPGTAVGSPTMLPPEQSTPHEQPAPRDPVPAAVTPDVAAPAAPPPARPGSTEQSAPASISPDTTGSTDAGPVDPRRAPPLVILHAARSETARAVADQLASRTGLTPDQIDTSESADAPSRAVIRFYADKDHAMARRLGQELANLGYAWQIENLSDRPPSPDHQIIEVWLPRR